jgi:hypothetical protein
MAVTCTRVEPDDDGDDDVVRDGDVVHYPLQFRDAKFDPERADAEARDAWDEMKAGIDFRSRRKRGAPYVPRPRDPPWQTMEGGKRTYGPGLPGHDAAPTKDLAALQREANAAWEQRNAALRDAWRENRG